MAGHSWRRRKHQPHVPHPHPDPRRHPCSLRLHRHHPGRLGDRQGRSRATHTRQRLADDGAVLPGHARRRRRHGRLHPLDGAHLRRLAHPHRVHRVRRLHRHPAVHRWPRRALPAPVAGHGHRHRRHLLHGVPALRGHTDLHEHPQGRRLPLLQLRAGSGPGGAGGDDRRLRHLLGHGRRPGLHPLTPTHRDLGHPTGWPFAVRRTIRRKN